MGCWPGVPTAMGVMMSGRRIIDWLARKQYAKLWKVSSVVLALWSYTSMRCVSLYSAVMLQKSLA